MAVTATPKASTLQLTVETGVNADGSTKYGTRSLAYVNPAITNDDAYSIAAEIGNLQTFPVASIVLISRNVLTNA